MSQRDLSILKAQYLDAFEKAKVTGISSGSDFYLTSLCPANFANAKSWTKFTFSSSDYDWYSKQNTQDWKAAGGVALGPFTIGGQGGQNKSECNMNWDMENFEMSFEICQVPITRPWLKMNFLTSKTWRFAQGNQGFKSKFLSDGKRPTSNESMLPAIPTGMIFIRNLKLKSSNASESSSTIDSQVKAGGMVGYGPFIIGGGYGSSSNERKVNYHADAEGISVDGMQCIGFKCYLLPKSPNPDPTIKDWR